MRRLSVEKNTALQPMSPYGWYRLAEVLLAFDQPEEAQKVLRHLRQFEPAVANQLERRSHDFVTIPRALDGKH